MNARREIDLLHGTIADKLLFIALPLAATGFLQQLFNAADVAVVGRFVGQSAMAAVGSNAPVVNLLVNLFIGISLGTNVLIAQFIGQGDRDGAKRAVQTSVLFSLLAGVAFGVLAELAAPRLLPLLAVPEDVAGMALTYLRVYFLALPALFLYNFESAVFRARGDTRTPLLVLAVSGAVNVALNLFFVLVLHMAVAGVALATLASGGLSASLLFLLLWRDGTIDPRALRLDGALLSRMLRIGLPAGVQSAVFSVANICIQSAVNSLGTTVMAASAAAFNVEIFAYFVLNSFGQAITTLVGQSYGAGDLPRCRRTLRVGLGIDAAFTAAACGTILAFSVPLLSLFNGDPAVVSAGVTRVRYVCLSYAFSLLIDAFSGYMRGFGRSVIPAAVALVCIVGVRLTWVYAFFPLRRSFGFLMFVYPVSMALTAATMVACYFLFRRRYGF